MFAGKHGARDACEDAVGDVNRPDEFPLVNALPDLKLFLFTLPRGDNISGR